MPEQGTTKNFDRWRERLRFAKRLWEHRGLIGSQGGHSPMRTLIEFYRGNQWGMGEHRGLESDDLMTANKIFPVTNQMMAQIAARNPSVQTFARNEELVSAEMAVQNLINSDIRRQRWKRQLNGALRDHLFAPFGLLRHGFTPSSEYSTDKARLMQTYRPAAPDRPWVRRVPAWNVLLDPTKEGFHPDDGVEWVAFREVVDLKDLLDNPEMNHPKGLADFAGNIGKEWMGLSEDSHVEQSDPDREKRVEIFSVYEVRERTWFQLVLDGVDTWLRNPDDWPLAWETLPYSILTTNEQMDTPFSLPILDQAIPIQREINLVRTMISQLTLRLRRMVAVGSNAMDQTEFNKLASSDFVEFFQVKGSVNDAIGQIQVGGLPQELLLYLAQLEEDMREIVGQSKMGRAQRINVETAHEVERVQQGEDVAIGRIEDGYIDFARDTVRLYMQARRDTMQFTGAENVRLLGQRDADGLQLWTDVTPEMVAGDFSFEIEPGSTRRRDRDADVQRAGASFSIALQSPDQFNVNYFARKLAEAMGDPVDEALNPEALTASKVREVDQIRRNAGIDGEASAESGSRLDPTAIASLVGAPQGPVQ